MPYWARGRAFLGTRYAIMGGAMSWVSERNLVAAISNAGGFGVVACGSLAPDQLAAEIDGVYERCDKPFGVNIIVMHPELDALVATCVERQVGHVVLAGGLAPRRTIETLKEAGTRVVAFASTLPLARRLAKQGIDALIIEGMEAGGHIGPVSTNRARPGGTAPFRPGAGLRRRRGSGAATQLRSTWLWAPPAASWARASCARRNRSLIRASSRQ